ncbi:MAG: 16S rRNA (guanine(527)-N(7))-methyltransferase RsmG [Eubacteriales bacterium]|nr:16S rRNA (guanine(527)-N(7))-methyltransferase RsmG [Lachnospiraceae bacterium]MDO5127296.1 16S rRNA (guanine(527)-N(7))-methyltransferase RsmG [Eubacteriales bacterium]
MEKIREYVTSITDGKVILTENQLAQFDTYFHLLVEKNKVMNLTAITEREDVILKHFIDSLAVAIYFPDIYEKELSVIDVGTGAGFPGFPLKIAFPNLKVTLFDSLNKRVRFLQETAETLKIPVECIHGRAEEGGRNAKLREGFDVVVSRAVANMAVLAEYCMPFAKVGGYFIPYKTDKIEEELAQGKKAVSILGGSIKETKHLILPGSDIHRSFVFIKKVKPTPKSYPRKPGTASKQPLS